MPLKRFCFPGNITVYLPRDWFTRQDGPIDFNGCKSEQFDVTAYPNRPDIVDDRLTAFLEGIPINDSQKIDLGMAVSEVAMNAMTHDGMDPERLISVHFLYVARRYVLVGITDTLGPIPDASLASDPTDDETMAKLPEHGRGLFIIKQIVSIFGQYPDENSPTKEIWVGVDLCPEAAHEKAISESKT